MSRSSEVLKEYIFHVEGMDESVKARLTRDLEPIKEMGEYSWDISHLWHTEGGVYSPSSRHGKVYKDVEALMFAYANSFSVAYGVTKNSYY
jgi:hypothetical protein